MSVALWREIFNDLQQQIESGSLAAGAALPSEVALAEQWQVSRLTAHRALYELQRSGWVQRKRRVGTVVAPRTAVPTEVVACAFFDVTDQFEAMLLGSVRAALGKEARLSYYSTERCHTYEADLLERVGREQRGLILFPTCDPLSAPAINAFVASGSTLVCIDRVPTGVNCDAVFTANESAIFDLTFRLLSRGHRRIVYLSDREPHVSSTQDRFRGYQKAMSAALQNPAADVRFFEPHECESESGCRQLAEQVDAELTELLCQPNPPTAVICMRDHYAAAAWLTAQRLGVADPEKLQIAGIIDRAPWSLGLPASALCIRQDVATMGAIAVERLRARRAGDTTPPQNIEVPALMPDFG